MISSRRLQQRSSLLRAVREFFHSRGYLEVETPIRLPVILPECHIEPFETGDWFLQTSPEMCMKRLLSQGMDALFQICKVFRKGERGAKHLPEFTMLEWYRAGYTYMDLMEECESLLRFCDDRLRLGGALKTGGKKIDIRSSWEKLSLADAFDAHGSLSLQGALEKGLYEEILVLEIEPHLGLERPTFLHDYPLALASLAKRRDDLPGSVERFELYIGGLEMANGFTELTEPEEQRRRFLVEREQMLAMGKSVSAMPESFLDDLEKMPPAAGVAMGIDRLAMVCFDAEKIDDVVAFTPENLA